MGDYDFYLRHSSVGKGEWLGFRLARVGTAGIDGLVKKPYLCSKVAPAISPNQGASTPEAASTWRWRMDVLAVDALVGLLWDLPTDGRSAAEMRDNLCAFSELPSFDLKDVDATIYTVQMPSYSEELIEPFDAAHPNGGWLVHVELAQV